MLLLFRNNLLRTTVAKRLVVGVVLLAASGSALSAEWSLKSSIDQSLGYDSNVQMQQNAQGSFFYKIIPVLTLSHTTDVSEIRADALYGTQVYSDLPGFNQDMQNYALSGKYKTERFDWGIALNHSITPTRNNALQTSGNFSANAVSTTQSVSPSLTYHLSEIDNLTLASSYSATSFDNATNDLFRNYNNLEINFAWQRTWTERFSSSLGLFFSNYESKQSGSSQTSNINFDSYGINLTNAYNLSEKWKLSGTVGIRQTDSTISSVTSSSVGFLADFSADYTTDNLTTSFSFRRSLAPSNFGRLQEQTDAGMFLNYRIAENLSTGFNIYYSESTQVNFNDQASRENIVLQPSINWHLAPEWTLSGSYRYRTQDRTQDDFGNLSANNFAESHLIMLTLNFNWQGLSISK
ncbi:MAG: hypothetical protein IPN42_09860 [Methylococcaceae bacterium]|nr:hypothetical protein [Methylococcaceae bacterium]